jgi:hypothetical protein
MEETDSSKLFSSDLLNVMMNYCKRGGSIILFTDMADYYSELSFITDGNALFYIQDGNFIRPYNVPSDFWGDGCLYVNTNDWITYLQECVAKAKSISWWWRYWPGTFMGSSADTILTVNNQSYALKEDTGKDYLFYIESMGVWAKGSEINYVYQGILYARMDMPEYICWQFPYAWKTINTIADLLNPYWNPGYTLPTNNELLFTYMGYLYYGAPKELPVPILML